MSHKYSQRDALATFSSSYFQTHAHDESFKLNFVSLLAIRILSKLSSDPYMLTAYYVVLYCNYSCSLITVYN